MTLRTHLLGCPIDSLSLNQTVEEIVRRIRTTSKPMQHCVVNTFKFLLMNRDPLLKVIVHNCDLINADGQSVVWALKLLGRPIAERVTGIDLMEALIGRATQEQLNVYFFGGRPDVLEKVISLYKHQYPTLVIAGYQHGYFRRAGEEEKIAERIREGHPHILFVALDSPRKEYWLARHLPELNIPFAMGVGGSFDIISGLYSRAPRWMQTHGLEWLWRLKQDPKRMWRRYVKSHSLFAWLLLKELIVNRRNGNEAHPVKHPRHDQPSLK